MVGMYLALAGNTCKLLLTCDAGLLLQVLFKDPVWQGLTASEQHLFLTNGTCPGKPSTPIFSKCLDNWLQYLMSFVQPWEPLSAVLDDVNAYVQSFGQPSLGSAVQSLGQPSLASVM